MWGIGVDADQSYLGTRILTSALKKVDNGGLRTIAAGQGRQVQGGNDLLFNLKNGGVGVGKFSPRCRRDRVQTKRSIEADRYTARSSRHGQGAAPSPARRTGGRGGRPSCPHGAVRWPPARRRPSS